MAVIEVELDDKGEIVGEMPEALKGLFVRAETTSHGVGFAKGRATAAEDAKKQIAETIASELAKKEALLPIEREKWAQIDADNKVLRTRMIEADSEHNRTLKDREEAHARELLDRAEALKKRNRQIEASTRAQLRSDASRAGARDESLSELEVILHSDVGYTDDMVPFVKNGDGTPKTIHGKPQTLVEFVKEYLDTHTHHKKPPTGSGGGGARGGATLHGHAPPPPAEVARARVESGDRSAGAINDLFQATRTKGAA